MKKGTQLCLEMDTNRKRRQKMTLKKYEIKFEGLIT